MKDEYDTFTGGQREVFEHMRDSYSQDSQCFTAPELARLVFLRWLYDTDRLALAPSTTNDGTRQWDSSISMAIEADVSTRYGSVA